MGHPRRSVHLGAVTVVRGRFAAAQGPSQGKDDLLQAGACDCMGLLGRTRVCYTRHNDIASR